MSFTMMARLLGKEAIGDPIANLILIHVANAQSDDGGWCHKSVATLAALTGASDRTIQDRLRKLTAEGIITEGPQVPCSNGYTRSFRVDDASLRRFRDYDRGATRNRCSRRTGEYLAPVQEAHLTGAEDAPARVHISHPNLYREPNLDTPPVPPRRRRGRVDGATKSKGDKRGGAKRPSERDPPGFAEAWNIWPRPGSSRERALKAWRAHRAPGQAKLAAVRAYLSSKQAQAENGRFVPYLQRWLGDSLGSFVEHADRAAKASAERAAKTQKATPTSTKHSPTWSAVLAALTEAQPTAATYWRSCTVVNENPLTVETSSLLAFERLKGDFAPKAAADHGVSVTVLNARDHRPVESHASALSV